MDCGETQLLAACRTCCEGFGTSMTESNACGLHEVVSSPPLDASCFAWVGTTRSPLLPSDGCGGRDEANKARFVAMLLADTGLPDGVVKLPRLVPKDALPDPPNLVVIVSIGFADRG